MQYAILRTKAYPERKLDGIESYISLLNSTGIIGSQYRAFQLTISNGLDSITTGFTVILQCKIAFQQLLIFSYIYSNKKSNANNVNLLSGKSFIVQRQQDSAIYSCHGGFQQIIIVHTCRVISFSFVTIFFLNLTRLMEAHNVLIKIAPDMYKSVLKYLQVGPSLIQIEKTIPKNCESVR